MENNSRLLLSFLPDGPPWPKGKRSLSRQIADLFSDAITLKLERLDSIIKNLDPRTAETWLPEWEKALGLPSSRSALSERQRRAYAAYVKVSDLSLSALKERIRAETGITPEIDESYPLGVGEIEAGSELDSEASAFVAIVRNVPLSKAVFDILKEFWQAHTLFVIEADGKTVPVRGQYAPN